MAEAVLAVDSLPSRSWMEVELVLHCTYLLGGTFTVSRPCPALLTRASLT